MVAGGSISATQIYKPQNVIAWAFMTLGPGLMTLIKYNSPKHAWAPLCVFFANVHPLVADALSLQARSFLDRNRTPLRRNRFPRYVSQTGRSNVAELPRL